MTDNQLATLSTIIWLVLTTVLFVELANWSAGSSWTIVPGLVRGVRGWVTRGQEADLPAFALAPGGMTRAGVSTLPTSPGLRGAQASDARSVSSLPAPPLAAEEAVAPGAEIEELSESPLSGGAVRSVARSVNRR